MQEEIFQLTLKKRILIIIGSVILFVVATLGFFIVFRNGGVDHSVATIMSVIVGGIIVWIILSVMGILKEFSIKGGPIFELTSKIAETKKELQNTLVQSGIKPEEIDPQKSISEKNLEKITSLFEKIKVLEDTSGKKIPLSMSEIMNQANYYTYSKKYRNAIRCYESILDKEPENIHALFNIAYAYSKIDEHKKSISFYEKLLKLKPQHDGALTNIGPEYSDLGNEEKALEWYKKALEINPDNYMAITNIGIQYSEKGEYEKALEYFNRSLEIHPHYDNTLTSIGVAYHRLGKHEKALEYYNKALEENMHHDSGWFNKACLKAQLGDKEEALYLLKQAIKLNSKHKTKVKDDKDFESLWNDSQFIKLIS